MSKQKLLNFLVVDVALLVASLSVFSITCTQGPKVYKPAVNKGPTMNLLYSKSKLKLPRTQVSDLKRM